MPPVDGTLMAFAVSETSSIFIDNLLPFLTGAVGLLVAITLPLFVVKGGLGRAIGGLASLFRR